MEFGVTVRPRRYAQHRFHPRRFWRQRSPRMARPQPPGTRLHQSQFDDGSLAQGPVAAAKACNASCGAAENRTPWRSRSRAVMRHSRIERLVGHPMFDHSVLQGVVPMLCTSPHSAHGTASQSSSLTTNRFGMTKAPILTLQSARAHLTVLTLWPASHRPQPSISVAELERVRHADPLRFAAVEEYGRAVHAPLDSVAAVHGRAAPGTCPVCHSARKHGRTHRRP